MYYLSWLKAKILKGEEVFYTAVLTDVQTLFRVESNILLAVKTFCCADIVKEKQFCSQTRLVGEMRKCAVKMVKGYKVKHHPFSQKNSSKNRTLNNVLSHVAFVRNYIHCDVERVPGFLFDDRTL